MKTIKLNKAQTDLVDFTANEPRQNLECLLIRNGEVIAADGFSLLKTPTEAHKDDNDILIPAVLIRQIRTVAKKEDITFTIGDEVTTAFAKPKGKPTVMMRALTPKLPYINLEKCQTFHAPSKSRVALNYEYLMRLATIAKNSPEGVVRLYIREETDTVEFITGDYHGLIMPMYVDWDWGEIKPYPVTKK